jgi:molecular chaperone GrpE
MEQEFSPKNEENQSPTGSDDTQPSQPPEKEEPQEIEIIQTPSETVKQEVEEAKERAGQLSESLQRLAADFENYKKRVAKERQETILSSNASLILKLLDIYEGLKKAITTFPSGIDPNHLDGLKMLHDEFSRILKNEGLESIETVGKPFDVHKHEVLMQQVNDDLPEDTILEEIQSGYILNSRVLRHAKVIVSQESQPPTEEKQEDVKELNDED